MFEACLSYEQSTICPKCGASLYQEVWESERKVYGLCEKSDCGYEGVLSYEYLKFTFVYRDEFTTEITAKNLEDAIKQLDNAAWNDLTPNYVPTLIRELSTFFILQSGRRSVAEPGGLQLAAKAAGVI